ncbi:hypothetical protein ES705_28531 [subsurface metagenome]
MNESITLVVIRHRRPYRYSFNGLVTFAIYKPNDDAV